MGLGRDLMVMLYNVVMGFCRVYGFKGVDGISIGYVWKFRGFSLDIEQFAKDLEGFLKGFT